MGKLLLISIQIFIVCCSAQANSNAFPQVQESNLSFSAKIVLAVIIAVVGLSALRAYIKSDEQ